MNEHINVSPFLDDAQLLRLLVGSNSWLLEKHNTVNDGCLGGHGMLST